MGVQIDSFYLMLHTHGAASSSELTQCAPVCRLHKGGVGLGVGWGGHCLSWVPSWSIWTKLCYLTMCVFWFFFVKNKIKTVIDDRWLGYYECSHKQKYHQTLSNCITVLWIRRRGEKKKEKKKSFKIKWRHMQRNISSLKTKNVPQTERSSSWL